MWYKECQQKPFDFKHCSPYTILCGFGAILMYIIHVYYISIIVHMHTTHTHTHTHTHTRAHTSLNAVE